MRLNCFGFGVGFLFLKAFSIHQPMLGLFGLSAWHLGVCGKGLGARTARILFRKFSGAGAVQWFTSAKRPFGNLSPSQHDLNRVVAKGFNFNLP